MLTEFGMLESKEWLAEYYHWFCARQKREDNGFIDFPRLLRIAKQQIRYSNLTDSTIRGSGFGTAPSQTTRRLSGPPILVQVMAFKEITRLRERREFRFRLSDGEIVIDAFIRAPSSCSFDFEEFRLGCKVSGRAVSEPHIY